MLRVTGQGILSWCYKETRPTGEERRVGRVQAPRRRAAVSGATPSLPANGDCHGVGQGWVFKTTPVRGAGSSGNPTPRAAALDETPHNGRDGYSTRREVRGAGLVSLQGSRRRRGRLRVGSVLIAIVPKRITRLYRRLPRRKSGFIRREPLRPGSVVAAASSHLRACRDRGRQLASYRGEELRHQ